MNFMAGKARFGSSKNHPKSQDPQKVRSPLPLGRSLDFACECFPALLDVLWSQWMHPKLSTHFREHVRNNFGRIKHDLEPISWQEKHVLEVQKNHQKSQDPQKFRSLLPLGRESKFCLWVFSWPSRHPIRSMNISKIIYTLSRTC